MRPRKTTKILKPPRVRGFIPLGYYGNESEPIYLFLEEYESIRLLDFDNLSQAETAELMGISRPTLTRIYRRARQKIAQALTNSQQLLIEGGTAIYQSNWYECLTCKSHFDKQNEQQPITCPLCQSKNISKLS